MLMCYSLRISSDPPLAINETHFQPVNPHLWTMQTCIHEFHFLQTVIYKLHDSMHHMQIDTQTFTAQKALIIKHHTICAKVTIRKYQKISLQNMFKSFACYFRGVKNLLFA